MRRALYHIQYVTKAIAGPLLTRIADAARRTPRRLPAHLRAATRAGYPPKPAHRYRGPFGGLAAMALLGACLSPAAAQRPIDLLGTWRIEATSGQGPREVVIRGDSSVTWGKESTIWMVKGEHLAVAIGGEWEIYRMKTGRDALTLSGGDLQKPVTLRKVGPPVARPAGRKTEPAPDTPPRWPH